MDCLKCGANFEGERCPYCGWVAEKKESNRQILRILKKEWSRTNKVQLHNRYSYKEK